MDLEVQVVRRPRRVAGVADVRDHCSRANAGSSAATAANVRGGRSRRSCPRGRGARAAVRRWYSSRRRTERRPRPRRRRTEPREDVDAVVPADVRAAAPHVSLNDDLREHGEHVRSALQRRRAVVERRRRRTRGSDGGADARGLRRRRHARGRPSRGGRPARTVVEPGAAPWSRPAAAPSSPPAPSSAPGAASRSSWSPLSSSSRSWSRGRPASLPWSSSARDHGAQGGGTPAGAGAASDRRRLRPRTPPVRPPQIWRRARCGAEARAGKIRNAIPAVASAAVGPPTQATTPLPPPPPPPPAIRTHIARTRA